MKGWTIYIAPVKRELFEDAVDRAIPDGDAPAGLVASAKDAMKAVVKHFPDPCVSAHVGSSPDAKAFHVDVFGEERPLFYPELN